MAVENYPALSDKKPPLTEKRMRWPRNDVKN